MEKGCVFVAMGKILGKKGFKLVSHYRFLNEILVGG